MLHTLSDSPTIAIRADRIRRPVGILAIAGIPETSHIKAGIPTIKMANPRKYPNTCFIVVSKLSKEIQHSQIEFIWAFVRDEMVPLNENEPCIRNVVSDQPGVLFLDHILGSSENQRPCPDGSKFFRQDIRIMDHQPEHFGVPSGFFTFACK